MFQLKQDLLKQDKLASNVHTGLGSLSLVWQDLVKCCQSGNISKVFGKKTFCNIVQEIKLKTEADIAVIGDF